MTDRDRLLNKLKKAKTNCLIKEGGGCLACTYRGQADCTLENLADDLLADGVIVPPCKVGDTVYTIFKGDIKALKVTCAKTEESAEFVYRFYDARNKFLNMPFSDRSIGKTVFLTKEEAEEKLKELKE